MITIFLIIIFLGLGKFIFSINSDRLSVYYKVSSFLLFIGIVLFVTILIINENNLNLDKVSVFKLLFERNYLILRNEISLLYLSITSFLCLILSLLEYFYFNHRRSIVILSICIAVPITVLSILILIAGKLFIL